MSENKEQIESQDEVEPPKKNTSKTKKILFVGLGIITFVSLIAAVFLMIRKTSQHQSLSQVETSHKEQHPTPNEKGDNSKSEESVAPNFGDTYLISEMNLNLSNALENRFVSLGVAIEYHGGANQLNELKKREAQIKDIIIRTTTSKTRTELLTENGKELLRREMINRINEVCDKPVQNVFFTQFLLE